MIDKNVMINLLCQHPAALTDRRLLLSLLSDYFPNMKSYRNVLLIAFDCGIVSEIENNELSDLLVMRVSQKMTNEYFVNNDIAQEIIRFWCEVYGYGILNKELRIGQSNKPIATDKNNPPLQKNNILEDALSILDRAKAKPGQKHPKTLVKRSKELERLYHIDNMDFSFKETDDGIMIVGQITVEDTTHEWLLCCSVYDACGRLVRYETCAPTDPESKRKKFDFEVSIWLPKDVAISCVFLYPMENPLFDERL